MTVFLGILFSSIKEIEVPYVFDWEHGTPLQAMHGNQASLAVRAKSHEFSQVAGGTWGKFSTYAGDGHLKLKFLQRSPDSCLVRMDTSGI